MILGMSVATFTLLHVVISLIGIATGVIVVYGMWTAKRPAGWTAVFLVTTIATSVTGFLFHSTAIGPPHIVGAISLVVLAVTLLALYTFHLAGRWRAIHAVTAVLALYLNVFVGVVQAFLKIPALHDLAPLGNEPPFAIAQGLVFALFVALGYGAVKRFHPPGA
ncbi:MAG TPA: hypothetical protein VE046_05645 [Steroidobacteraceae bacterium]|nr:hypothetical protein [Steroidobacteraceae bacterium]